MEIWPFAVFLELVAAPVWRAAGVQAQALTVSASSQVFSTAFFAGRDQAQGVSLRILIGKRQSGVREKKRVENTSPDACVSR